MAISVISSGMPSSSFNSGALARTAVVHAVPNPLARRATQKLHPLWMTESNKPGAPLPSWRPTMVGMTITGTSAKCSTR